MKSIAVLWATPLPQWRDHWPLPSLLKVSRNIFDQCSSWLSLCRRLVHFWSKRVQSQIWWCCVSKPKKFHRPYAGWDLDVGAWHLCRKARVSPTKNHTVLRADKFFESQLIFTRSWWRNQSVDQNWWLPKRWNFPKNLPASWAASRRSPWTWLRLRTVSKSESPSENEENLKISPR